MVYDVFGRFSRTLGTAVFAYLNIINICQFVNNWNFRMFRRSPTFCQSGYGTHFVQVLHDNFKSNKMHLIYIAVSNRQRHFFQLSHVCVQNGYVMLHHQRISCNNECTKANVQNGDFQVQNQRSSCNNESTKAKGRTTFISLHFSRIL